MRGGDNVQAPEELQKVASIYELCYTWLQNYQNYDLQTEPGMLAQYPNMLDTCKKAKAVLAKYKTEKVAAMPAKVGANKKPAIEFIAPKEDNFECKAANLEIKAKIQGITNETIECWHNDIATTNFNLAGTLFTCNLALTPLKNTLKLVVGTIEASRIIHRILDLSIAKKSLDILYINASETKKLVNILQKIPTGTIFPKEIADMKAYEDTALQQLFDLLKPIQQEKININASILYIPAYEAIKATLGADNLDQIQTLLDSKDVKSQMTYFGNDWSVYAGCLLTNKDYEVLKKYSVADLQNLELQPFRLFKELQDRRSERNKQTTNVLQDKINELAANKGQTPEAVVNALNKFIEQRSAIESTYTILSDLMSKQNVACITPVALEEIQKNWAIWQEQQKNWTAWKKIINEQIAILAAPPPPSKKNKNPQPLFSLDNVQEKDLENWGAYAKFYCTDFKFYINKFDAGFNKLNQVYQGLVAGQKNVDGQQINSYMPENNLAKDNYVAESYTGKNTTLAVDIEAGDIDQGSLGNCYYMASIATLANTMPEAFLEGDNAIIKQEGEGADIQYIVTLQLPCADGKRQATKIIVKPEFLTKKGTRNNKDIVEGGSTFKGSETTIEEDTT